MRNLLLAYVATWMIHLAYVIFLVRKSARLAKEVRELRAEPDA